MNPLDRRPIVADLRRWLSVVAWMALIVALSSQPAPTVSSEPALDVLVKKLGHVALFAILAVTLAHALLGTRLAERALLIAFVGTVAFAISDELHQTLTPGRSPSALDVVIDAAGA